MHAHWKLRTMRPDSEFFKNALLTFLDARDASFIVAARLTQTLKRKAAGIAETRKAGSEPEEETCAA